MADKLNVIIFMGSVREGRFGERVTDFVKKGFAARGNYNVEVYDPEKMDFHMLKKPLHFYRDQTEAPEWLRNCNEQIKDADGFIIVSPEYNCTIPPALSNMMDHFPPASYAHRPTSIVTYSMGSLGGARVAVALRPFLCELSTPSLPYSMVIPKVQEAIAEDGTINNTHLDSNLHKLIDQLEWYASALKNHKKSVGKTPK